MISSRDCRPAIWSSIRRTGSGRPGNRWRPAFGKLGAEKARIAGIGVSGQQHGLVVLDAKDEVVRPAKLWCDTSTAAQCDQIAHEFGGQPGCIHLAGNAMLPGYTIPKILWLKQNEPRTFCQGGVDPAAARLPQFLAQRREAHGIRRCQRHGNPQCAHPDLVPRNLRFHRPARARHAAAAGFLPRRPRHAASRTREGMGPVATGSSSAPAAATT